MKDFFRIACAVLPAVLAVTALAAYDVRMVGVVFDAGADKFESQEKQFAYY